MGRRLHLIALGLALLQASSAYGDASITHCGEGCLAGLTISAVTTDTSVNYTFGGSIDCGLSFLGLPVPTCASIKNKTGTCMSESSSDELASRAKKPACDVADYYKIDLVSTKSCWLYIEFNEFIDFQRGNLRVKGGGGRSSSCSDCNGTLIAQDCITAVCGNGVLEPSEECDDGNTANGDGCSDRCKPEVGCCDGGAPEFCGSAEFDRCSVPRTEGGNCVSPTPCCTDRIANTTVLADADCCAALGHTPGYCPVCGNGVTEGAEECDDGNTNSGDGCDHQCFHEIQCCFDETSNLCAPAIPSLCASNAGVERPGGGSCSNETSLQACCLGGSTQQCADPVCCEALPQATPGVCLRCGNGVVQPGEECDDGNTVDGDGCSEGCEVEANWACATGPAIPARPCFDAAPSVCTEVRGSCCWWVFTGEGEPDHSECHENLTVTQCAALSVQGGPTRFNGGGTVCPSLQPDLRCCLNGQTIFGPAAIYPDCCDVLQAGAVAKIGSETCTGLTGSCCRACVCFDDPATIVKSDCAITADDARCQSHTFNVSSCPSCDGAEVVDTRAFTQNATCALGTCAIISRCGDGVLNSIIGEECDDGNTASGDGCDSTCIVERGSCCLQCLADSNTTVPVRACLSNVKSSQCVTEDFACDAGQIQVATFSLTAQCSDAAFCAPQSTCGDGVLNPALGEQCDDGNDVLGDGCDQCVIGQRCCSPPENFSPGCSIFSPTLCTVNLTAVSLNGTECVDEPCCWYIDETQNPRYETTSTDPGCCVAHGSHPGTCPVCGDGVVGFNEACDDGNTASGDGCSSACNIEAGHSCTGEPSICCPPDTAGNEGACCIGKDNFCDFCSCNLCTNSGGNWTAPGVACEQRPCGCPPLGVSTGACQYVDPSTGTPTCRECDCNLCAGFPNSTFLGDNTQCPAATTGILQPVTTGTTGALEQLRCCVNAPLPRAGQCVNVTSAQQCEVVLGGLLFPGQCVGPLEPCCNGTHTFFTDQECCINAGFPPQPCPSATTGVATTGTTGVVVTTGTTGVATTGTTGAPVVPITTWCQFCATSDCGGVAVDTCCDAAAVNGTQCPHPGFPVIRRSNKACTSAPPGPFVPCCTGGFPPFAYTSSDCCVQFGTVGECPVVTTGTTGVPAPVCGNGVLEFGEECDDNNTISGDGCSSTCQTDAGVCCVYCLSGDGVSVFGPTCTDVGNSGDICGGIPFGSSSSPDCPFAGGAIVQNHVDNTTCASSPCPAHSVCGDGTLDIVLGEECDDGNTVNGDGCDLGCKIEPNVCCRTFFGERCDTFTSAECAANNGVLFPNTTACDPQPCCVDVGHGYSVINIDPHCCSHFGGHVGPCPVCGDRVVGFNEECDDGNAVSGDGCSSSCIIEQGSCCLHCITSDNITFVSSFCGTEFSNVCGTVIDCPQGSHGRSVWDFAATCGPVFCPPQSTCGDGVVNSLFLGEECDDGNLVGGDGCSFDCKKEWPCCSGGENCFAEFLTPENCAREATLDQSVINATENCSSVICCLNGQSTSGDRACCLHAGGSFGSCCGNGVLDLGEECDDGNTVSGDGCSSTCQTEGVCCIHCVKNGTTSNAVCVDVGGSGDICDGFPAPECPFEEVPWTIVRNHIDNTTCANSPCPVDIFCGDGVLDIALLGEQCDDGNTVSGDGCSSTCQTEGVCCIHCAKNGTIANAVCTDVGDSGDICGGIVALECPFAEVPWTIVRNHTDNTTCASSPCPVDSFCGDGVLDTVLGEQCDDGNTVSGDGCSSTCTVEVAGTTGVPTLVCGNGVLEAVEQCDDNNTVSGDGCSSSCFIESGTCCNNCISDDDITIVSSQCLGSEPSNTCGQSLTCPQGSFKRSVWDYAAFCNSVFCPPVSTCGDGVVNPSLGEECDDGNTAIGDGCSISCTIDLCGNGVLDAGEECDDGNVLDNDGCSPTCTKECGDGTVGIFEYCDDGNLVNGDGCSSTCVVELGWTCTDETPSDCSMSAPVKEGPKVAAIADPDHVTWIQIATFSVVLLIACLLLVLTFRIYRKKIRTKRAARTSPEEGTKPLLPQGQRTGQHIDLEGKWA